MWSTTICAEKPFCKAVRRESVSFIKAENDKKDKKAENDMKNHGESGGKVTAPQNKGKMNVPNTLTLSRIVAVPVLMVIFMLPESIAPFMLIRAIVGFLFILTSVTDLLDGKIAREYNLVTDFGKFMDPIADKILVTGIMLCICMRCESLKLLYFVALTVVLFREFTVTSMRLVMAKKDTVVAANIFGKIKTVFQIICVSCALLETPLYWTIGKLAEKISGKEVEFFGALMKYLPLTWITTVAMIFFTVFSGYIYIKSYWKYLDPQK